MGSPLSPLLAEIFMNHLEETLFKSQHPLTKNIFYWYRYVDDILCCWSSTARQLQNFLNHINNLEPSITFTLEIEHNKSINFLDLNIKITNNKHDFSIFRKPTYSDAVIPFSSSHPWFHKIAFFNSMIHRLLNIPMSQLNFVSEINILKQIAINNAYPPAMIDRLIAKKQQKIFISEFLYKTPNPTAVDKKFLRLPYYPSISDKIKSLIPNHKYTVSFYTPFNLSKALFNNKDPTPQLFKSGIYQLFCKDCTTSYIGKTNRSFQTRIKEHTSHWTNKRPDKSNFADHLLTHDHTFDPTTNIKFLHTENNATRLTHLEIYEINQHNNLCNYQTTFILNSPLLNLKLN